MAPGLYIQPQTGQVASLNGDADALERWLLTELDESADAGGLEVHARVDGAAPPGNWPRSPRS